MEFDRSRAWIGGHGLKLEYTFAMYQTIHCRKEICDLFPIYSITWLHIFFCLLNTHFWLHDRACLSGFSDRIDASSEKKRHYEIRREGTLSFSEIGTTNDGNNKKYI